MRALLIIAVLALVSTLPMFALAQNGYSPRPPYGTVAATPATPASAAVAAPGRPAQAAPSVARPAPASPMPTPLPTGNVGAALDQSAPLTPDEIRKLMSELITRQEAANENFTKRPPAKPVTSQEQIDLSPGATPPVVRVAMGQGSILSFVDAAGRPWPIADDRNFNTRAYEVKLVGEHLYSISLLKKEAANMTVVLKGLARPIIITVLPATDETDYLKEYTVPKFLNDTPPATVMASSQEGTLAFNSPELINYLYRTPPRGAKQLTVSGLPGVMAWQTGPAKMVLRTSGQVVIPAFSRRHGSGDGVTVFELPLSPVVSITEGGSLHRVSIGDYTVSSNPASSAAPNTR